VGYAVAALCLAWVVHELDFERLWRDLRSLRWEWMWLAVVVNPCGFVVQGVRWQVLLSVLSGARVGACVRAVFAGQFANAVLPLRAGEVLRAWLVSRETGTRLALVLTSVGVERLLDGVVLAALLAVVSLGIELPGKMQGVARGFGIGVGVVLLLFIGGAGYLRAVPELPPGAHPLRVKVRRLLGPILDGIRLLGTSRKSYVAGVISLGIPACQVFGLWALARAYGLGLTLWEAAVVLIVINLGVAVPLAPGNVGAYPFFCVLGLSLFGVEKSSAAGFALVAHTLFTLAQTAVGFVAVLRSGMTFATLREQAGRLAGGGERAPESRAE
jgi:uncharacterized protein (TIRG00374 family)